MKKFATNIFSDFVISIATIFVFDIANAIRRCLIQTRNINHNYIIRTVCACRLIGYDIWIKRNSMNSVRRPLIGLNERCRFQCNFNSYLIFQVWKGKLNNLLIIAWIRTLIDWFSEHRRRSESDIVHYHQK